MTALSLAVCVDARSLPYWRDVLEELGKSSEMDIVTDDADPVRPKDRQKRLAAADLAVHLASGESDGFVAQTAALCPGLVVLDGSPGLALLERILPVSLAALAPTEAAGAAALRAAPGAAVRVAPLPGQAGVTANEWAQALLTMARDTLSGAVHVEAITGRELYALTGSLTDTVVDDRLAGEVARKL